MFSNKDIEKARFIVESISFPDRFGSDDSFDDCGAVFNVDSQLEDVIEGDYFVTCGVSKLVIVVKDLPFVIKIPFDGRWEYTEYEDEDEKYEDEEHYFIEFSHADDDGGSDYCGRELDDIQLATKEGFGYFFPDMTFLGIFSGRCVYLQEKVSPISDCYHSLTPSENSLKKAMAKKSKFIVEWLALVYDLYGEAAFKEFSTWVELNRPEIMTDCHSGNYGVDSRGCPVLFDVSGFRD